MSEGSKTKIIYAIGMAAFLWSLGSAYYRYAIAMDYDVLQEVWCDPETEETCFYYICENDWWTPCSGDPEEDIWIYKVIQKPARDVEEGLFVEECGTDFSGEKECPEIACDENDAYCHETYCDPVVDENCYTEGTAARVEEEWLAVLAGAGIEPILFEEKEDVLEEGEDAFMEDEAEIESVEGTMTEEE